MTSRAGLGDEGRPVGVFLLAGTSGVGKTETALALAENLFGDEKSVTTINMSEYKETHKVSTLMGPPPGYVGYGEGGVLTEAVRRRPYSVVLLDEVEKANVEVQDVFFQVFDKGAMKDSEGRDIDFRNTIILLTTNIGTETLTALALDSSTMPDADGLVDAIWPELVEAFKPAFLGRLTPIPYLPLDSAILGSITKLKLDRIAERLEQGYGAQVVFADNVIVDIAKHCQSTDIGARAIDNLLRKRLLPPLSAECLSRVGNGIEVREVAVDFDADQTEFRFSIS